MKVIIQQKNVYGKTLLYPINTNAQLFAELIGKKTLDINDLRTIKQLGFEVENAREIIKI